MMNMELEEAFKQAYVIWRWVAENPMSRFHDIEMAWESYTEARDRYLDSFYLG